MSNAQLHHLRSFLTERFTTVAVEIFGEIETIVEAYYEENKHLRNVLHMVLNPEIKLPRIDDNQYNGATTDVREPNIVVEEISEHLPKEPKEEQTEYDISTGSEQHGLEEADNCITTDCVKSDPDNEDTSITDSFHIEAVQVKCNSSGTVTADEGEDVSASYSEAFTDLPQISKSKESTSQSLKRKTCGIKSRKRSTKQKKPKISLQKTMLELPRMVHNQAVIPAPSDCQSFLARLTEAYEDFPDDKKPLIIKMGLTENVELVDSAFGKVPKGCPLSYQRLVPSGRDYKTCDDAPSHLALPLSRHILKRRSILPTLSAEEQEHIDVMQITWSAARSLEHATRGSKETAKELRKLRLTSHFKEICKFKPGRSNAEHLIFKIQKGLSKTAQMEVETKAETLREYCKHLCVNWYPCGLVVYPISPWLGVMPDGLVYDPKETHSFGLVHVVCIGLRSFTECKFLSWQDGVLQLKRTHSHYWNIQAEMMVTGTDWCDLLVLSREDILVQRIYRDTALIKAMKEKLDDFFFFYYLPCLF